MSPTTIVASDPSVADYRDTSPSEWGGFYCAVSWKKSRRPRIVPKKVLASSLTG
jgi:hypothetical protein